MINGEDLFGPGGNIFFADPSSFKGLVPVAHHEPGPFLVMGRGCRWASFSFRAMAELAFGLIFR
jgi:hypothetical protein